MGPIRPSFLYVEHPKTALAEFFNTICQHRTFHAEAGAATIEIDRPA
jgi:hypothetical protein